MGAVAWAMRQRPVSHPRSSNRTCRSPASGSPTGFTVRHTGSRPTARGFSTVSTLLRPSTQQSRTAPVFSGVFRLIANHHDLAIFESAPEVRALCSASVTRPQRSYDPVRLPSWPIAFRNVEAATLATDGSPPITRTTFPTCRAHYPGGSSGCACRLLPRSCSLPQMAGGSASALSLSRPAQASLALRPAGSLSRPQATFVTRLQPFRLPGRAARQLPDQSTTLRVESSSTDDSRLRGALPGTDSCTATNNIFIRSPRRRGRAGSRARRGRAPWRS